MLGQLVQDKTYNFRC